MISDALPNTPPNTTIEYNVANKKNHQFHGCWCCCCCNWFSILNSINSLVVELLILAAAVRKANCGDDPADVIWSLIAFDIFWNWCWMWLLALDRDVVIVPLSLPLIIFGTYWFSGCMCHCKFWPIIYSWMHKCRCFLCCV